MCVETVLSAESSRALKQSAARDCAVSLDVTVAFLDAPSPRRTINLDHHFWLRSAELADIVISIAKRFAALRRRAEALRS